ncbi:hypothetical protein ES703_22604 [subsurface metagenome]
MDGKWFTRILQATAITLTLVAVFQELEKPKEERKWHGKIAGFIPYDFRIPTIERFKESCWNPYESRLFTPRVLGIGWGVNLYTLLERLRLFGETYVSEEDFLKPTKAIKELLAETPTAE